MAYNNIFPVSYPQYYPVYQQAPQPVSQPQQPQSAPQQPQGGIIWVQGEAGMKAYLVAPNSTVQLWDSERQTIYLKSADASGMPSVKVLDYTIRDQAAPAAPVAAATAHRETVRYMGQSPFAQAIYGRPANDIWLLMDDLMTAVRTQAPRLYDSIMRQL